MSVDRLGIELLATRTERDLHGAVAVLFRGLYLRDAVRKNLDHGHGHGLTGIREYARHARFAADESDCHDFASQHGRASIGATDLGTAGEVPETTGDLRAPDERRVASRVVLEPQNRPNLARCRICGVPPR